MKKLGFLLLFAFITAFSINAVQMAQTDSVAKSADSSSVQSSEYNKVLMQKLSPEQLYELEKARALGPDHDEPKLTSVGIVLISLAPFLTAILIVFFIVRNKRMKELRMIQLYEKALEAGKDLPDSFFRRPEAEQKSHLLKGLIWIGSGLGLSIGGLYLMGADSPWGFGLIPAFIGLAYLISYFVEKKGKANAAQDE
jgi:Domain of unknown function (DUF6249)